MAMSTMPPGNLRRLLEARAEAVAHDDADEREDKGRAADDERGSHDVDLQKREADADGQRIDAGGDGEHEQLAQVELLRGGFVICLLAPSHGSIPEHLAADEGKQSEGDPMVNRRDVSRKRASHQPADDRA